MECPGLYRCQKSSKRPAMCLTMDKVCNGERDCPMSDDETDCYSSRCPVGCTCRGNVLICHDVLVNSVYNSVNRDVRKMDIRHSSFMENKFSIPDYRYVAVLSFQNCSIRHISPFSFVNMTNILHLDLSYNRIEILYTNTFFNMITLKTLNIVGNFLLRAIEPMTFTTLHQIKRLDITGSRLEIIEKDVFIGLESLQFLNLSNNNIHTVKDNGFGGLNSLQSIDMTNNIIETFSLNIFSPLGKIENLKTDSFIFCCLKPASVLEENCYPRMDEFSSCSDLMRSNVLRICLWVIGLSALVGNLGVIFYRLIWQQQLLRKIHGFYILNLSISDFIMSIYLIIIAIADVYFKGEYILHDSKWRKSAFCNIAGVLSMVSSEASVTFIMLITIECFITIKFPFGTRRITLIGAKISCLVCWLIVLFLSVIPLIFTEYFSENFYSGTAVCLALPFTRSKIQGWEYSAAIFIFYNSFAFCVIVFSQIGIYSAATSDKRIMTKRADQDIAIARRLFLIVLSDFLCWFPIGVMGMLALQGHVFPSEVYSWVAVFVVPVNAALNPLLYTFSGLLNKKANLVKAITKRITYNSRKKQKRQAETKREMKICSMILFRRDELSWKHQTLKDLLRTRKLNPRECFFIVHKIVKAVAYLNIKGFVFSQQLNTNSVIVYLRKNKIVEVKIISAIKDIHSKNDMSLNVEDIGKIVKIALRYITHDNST